MSLTNLTCLTCLKSLTRNEVCGGIFGSVYLSVDESVEELLSVVLLALGGDGDCGLGQGRVLDPPDGDHGLTRV